MKLYNSEEIAAEYCNDMTETKFIRVGDILPDLINAREHELHSDWNDASCFNLVEDLILKLSS